MIILKKNMRILSLSILILMVISFYNCGLNSEKCDSLKKEKALCELAVLVAIPTCPDIVTTRSFSNSSTMTTNSTIRLRNTDCELRKLFLLDACRQRERKECGDDK
ncbi:MAG: hypothetical protein MUF77_03565 [Leptospira sp.]|jgi:hypothetical protein|nr:hypothetical protein [Leptospira sp.]